MVIITQRPLLFSQSTVLWKKGMESLLYVWSVDIYDLKKPGAMNGQTDGQTDRWLMVSGWWMVDEWMDRCYEERGDRIIGMTIYVVTSCMLV